MKTSCLNQDKMTGFLQSNVLPIFHQKLYVHMFVFVFVTT